jgi:hypothetical protein
MFLVTYEGGIDRPEPKTSIADTLEQAVDWFLRNHGVPRTAKLHAFELSAAKLIHVDVKFNEVQPIGDTVRPAMPEVQVQDDVNTIQMNWAEPHRVDAIGAWVNQLQQVRVEAPVETHAPQAARGGFWNRR